MKQFILFCPGHGYNLSMLNQEPAQIRIASYNIHAGLDARNRPSLPLILETLEKVNADIVLLQEVDRLLPRSGFRDQLHYMGKNAGYPHRNFSGRLKLGPCAFGNAILSRLEIQQWHTIALPAGGGEPRAAIGAVLATHGAPQIWCTHLGLRSDWRENQLAFLSERFYLLPETTPVILGGDFNASPGAPEIRSFLQATRMTDFDLTAPTFPAENPVSRIDHLLGKGVELINSGTREDPGSDHCLIWADFSLPRMLQE